MARRCLDWTATTQMHVRDHSNRARAEAALGATGKAAVKARLLRQAKALHFTNGAVLSSDTTVQEPALGYPNEPGILKGWAERLARSFKKLQARGVAGAQAGWEQTKELVRQVKQHHLWAKTKAEKKELLTQLVATSVALLKQTQAVIQAVSTRCGQAKQKAVAKLPARGAVGRRLVPQIKHWLQTGKVAAGKLIHVGLKEARAIVKGKRQVKFGFKWRINRLRLRVWAAGSGAGRREPAAGGCVERLPGSGRENGDAGNDRVRPRRERGSSGPGVIQSWRGAGRDPPARPRGMVSRGKRANRSEERTGENRRQHRQTQEPEIRLFRPPGTQRRDAGGGGAAGLTANLNTLLRDVLQQDQAARQAQH